MEAWAILGWLLIGMALLLVGWAEWELLDHGRGTALPFDAPRQLVTSGPYDRTRNPIYFGSFLSLLGGVLAAEWLPGLALSAAYLIALHLWVTRWEEPRLARRFGDPYREYLRTVPRWLPRSRSPVRQGVHSSQR